MKQSQFHCKPIELEKMRLPSGYQLDQYELEDILGIGDFRITYYAWDNSQNRNVVIQEYFPQSLAIRQPDHISVTSQEKNRFNDYEFGLTEFLLEARLISQARSPYLPTVVEYREANGTGYLISEFDDGKTLRDVLDCTQEPIKEEQLRAIMLSGLHALRELHARNLLHTSVNPLNIFMRLQGHPLILGQGLARYRLAQYTKTLSVSITPGYAPLEQYSLDGNIGPWSDLYALGATLYECIARTRPIDASTRNSAIAKNQEDPLTPIMQIGQGRFSKILLSNIDWMLQLDVENRPDSADLMLGIMNSKGPVDLFEKQKDTDLKNDSIPGAVHLESIKLTTKPRILDLPTAYAAQRSHHQKLKKFWLITLAIIFISFIAYVGVKLYQHENDAAKVSQLIPVDETTETAKKSIANQEVTSDQTLISAESDDERRSIYEKSYQEQEISRRIEEQLLQERAALEEQVRIDKQEMENRFNAQIAALLDKANMALKQKHLIKPTGNNAALYYNQILEMDPANLTAKQGMQSIGDLYYESAVQALKDQEIESANLNLKNMMRFNADDPRVDVLLTQIVALKTEQELIELQKLKPLDESENLLKAQNEDNYLSSTQKPDRLETVDSTNLADDINPVTQTRGLTEEEKMEIYQQYDSGKYSNRLFNDLLTAANNDDGRAQYLLAEMYAAGRGVNKNFAESTFWLKKSLDFVNQNAAARQSWAEKALGVIYEKGWHVDTNPRRAVSWYRSAANKGYAPAQYRLGLNYAKGLGVRKDIDQAVFWLNKASRKGHLEAQSALNKLILVAD